MKGLIPKHEVIYMPVATLLIFLFEVVDIHMDNEFGALDD